MDDKELEKAIKYGADSNGLEGNVPTSGELEKILKSIKGTEKGTDESFLSAVVKYVEDNKGKDEVEKQDGKIRK